MIRNEREYQAMLERLEQDRIFIKQQEKALRELGLSQEEIDRALEPSLCFHEQLKEEVEFYERIRRGDFGALVSLEHLGRLLIGLRIYRGISQKELAKRLNVSEAQVSRDERNEYHGITLERAQRILRALNFSLRSEVVDNEVPFENQPEEEDQLAVV